jgi:Ni,Fe-hydrogenase maturation factor
MRKLIIDCGDYKYAVDCHYFEVKDGILYCYDENNYAVHVNCIWQFFKEVKNEGFSPPTENSFSEAYKRMLDTLKEREQEESEESDSVRTTRNLMASLKDYYEANS